MLIQRACFDARDALNIQTLIPLSKSSLCVKEPELCSNDQRRIKIFQDRTGKKNLRITWWIYVAKSSWA